MIDIFNKKGLLTIAFIEGACVMAVELLGAKMIAPFFGSSLYVWAAVLGVTLLSLMSGYYIGGYLSQKRDNKKLILGVLIIAGLLISVMPYSSKWIMTLMIDSSIQAGSTISLLVFLLPQLTLLGMTSPLIINLINSSVDTSGKTAGSVYAISTLGGIIATFLIGFYLLPEYGITFSAFLFSGIIIFIPILAFFLKSKVKSVSLIVLYILIVSSASMKNTHTRGGIKEVYSSEGIMGQVKVYDMPFQTYTRGLKKGRVLMVNNTAQTIADKLNLKRDLWDYSYFFPSAVSTFPEGSDLLLLGLGGGSLLHHFDRLGFDTDVVELDERIKEVAIKYFDVNPDVDVKVDDARRYLNSCDKKYDIIVMDLFFNETPPAHVLSVESFNRIKKVLKEEGLLMINFYGFINGEEGMAARSILKTLKKVGYKVEILPTPGAEENRNLIFLAGDKMPDFSKNDYKLPDLPLLTDLESRFIDQKRIDLSKASILRDDKPELEKMYIPAALKWRSTSIEYNLKRLLKNNVL